MKSSSKPPASIQAYPDDSYSYPIHISYVAVEPPLIVDLLERLRCSSIVIFCDAFLSDNPVYLELLDALQQSCLSTKCSLFVKAIEPGKHSKSLGTIESLCQWLVSSCVQRDALFFAVGGGVVGDLIGFLSSTYYRGVPLVHVPTNLLSMCDSAIGGKTAVNTSLHVNSLGTYKHPVMNITLLNFLDSLTHREFAAGFAEIYKISLLPGGHDLYSLIEDHSFCLHSLRQDFNLIHIIIAKAIKLKLDYTSNDIQESSKRLFLNIGHTFGHAIESIQDLRSEEYFRHGEAVALGLCCCIALSDSLYGTNRLPGLQRTLQKLSLPTRIPSEFRDLVPCAADMFVDTLVDVAFADKKGIGGSLRLVLLDAHGQAVLFPTNNRDLMRQAFLAVV